MVDRLKDAGLKDGEALTCEAQTLMYLMKLRHNDSNKRLGNRFGVDEKTATVTFKNCMLRHFSEESGSHTMPRLWSQNLDEDAKDALYEQMANTNNRFYQDLVAQFGDPKDKGRRPVVIQIDSTNLLCEKPMDPQCQKKMFYNAKPAHYIKLTNIVDLRGQVVWFSKAGYSISPYQGKVSAVRGSCTIFHLFHLQTGDTMLFGTYIMEVGSSCLFVSMVS